MLRSFFLRPLLAAVTALVCSLLFCSFAQATTSGELTQYRALFRLGPVTDATPGSSLTKLADQLAANITDPTDFTFKDVYCNCTLIDDEGNETLPTTLFHRLGETGDADAWLLPVGSLQAALKSQPAVQVLLLDPRLQQVAFARTPDGNGEMMTVSLAPASTWTKPLILGDPKTPPAQKIQTLLPPSAHGRARLDIKTHGRWKKVVSVVHNGTPSNDDKPVWYRSTSGGVLAPLTDDAMVASPSLAWSTAYRLVAGGSYRFRTKAMSRALLRKSFTFTGGVTRADRRSFLTAVAHATGAAKKYLRRIDGMTLVGAFTGNGPAGDGMSTATTTVYHGRPMYKVTMNRAHLRESTRIRDEIVLHELGHIVDFSGLPSAGLKAFTAAWKRSPRWKSCFSHMGPYCTSSTTEIFADQFAFFATGKPASGWSRYGDPKLISGARTNRLLRAWVHLAPPPEDPASARG